MVGKMKVCRQLAVLPLLAALGINACTSSLLETPGVCMTDESLDCSVSFSPDGGDAKPVA